MSDYHSLNQERRLYTLKSGDGYTCLGFDNAERAIVGVLAWMGFERIAKAPMGTPEHYEEYRRVMSEGAEYSRANGVRCLLYLTKTLIGLEGKRVEVTTPDGEKSRFYVGKSTGWIPCHLAIKRRDSSGGAAVYFPEGSTVRVIR